VKKLPIVFACLFIILLVTGVAYLLQRAVSAFQSREISISNDPVSVQENLEATAIRTDTDITFHNYYLGFSYTIPKDWWIYDINEENFSPDPSGTLNPETLDISYGEDAGFNYSYIGLIDFANLRESHKDNHLGFNIFAESLDDVNTLEDYMEYLEEYMLRPDEYNYQLLDSGQTVINGILYEKRYYEVLRTSDNFIYVTYTRPVMENYYLTIRASYWPKNRNAESLIVNSLTKAMP